MNIDDLFEKHSTAYYDANEQKTEVLTKRRFAAAVAEIEQQLFVEERQNEMLVKECQDLNAEVLRLATLCQDRNEQIAKMRLQLKYEQTYDETKKA